MKGTGIGQVAGIRAVTYHLPPALSLEEWAQRTGVPQGALDQYQDTLGLRVVHAANGETPIDRAARAVEELLDAEQIHPESIDALIIYHSLYFLAMEPRTFAGQLRQRIGARRALSFSVSGQHCASAMAALRVARNMIAAGNARTVLLVSCDSFLGSLRREIPGITVMGEAASAAILQAGWETNRILTISTHVEGALYKGLTGPAKDDERFRLMYYLASRRLIRKTLQSLSLKIEDIRVIIPHNINWPSWEGILSGIKYPPERFFGDNIDRCGHVLSSDLIVNLTDAIRLGRIQKGDLVMMFTVGLGAVWGCSVLQH
jgi:3-oxoacyl-[acyl-carrier-protein] synthase III